MTHPLKSISSLLSACLLSIGLLGTLPRLAHADGAFAEPGAGRPTLAAPNGLPFALAAAAAVARTHDEAPGRGLPGRLPLPMMASPEALPLPPFLHGIELSEAQQDQAFAIVHEQLPHLREQGKALRKAAEGLRSLATAATAFDEGKARELSREEGRAAAELHLLMARTDSRLLALLTPQQRQQVEARRPASPLHGRG